MQVGPAEEREQQQQRRRLSPPRSLVSASTGGWLGAVALPIRRVLVFALMASGLKLLNVSTSNLGIILLAGLITGLHPRRHPRRRGDRPRPQHRLRVGRAGPG